MRIRPLLRLFVLSYSVLYALNLSAQTITPQVLSTTGNYSTGAGASLSGTVGECITTTLGSTPGNLITQGFQQPSDVIIVSGEDTIHIYSGITPNGDGKNDTWIIRGIESMHNQVYIFDRVGLQVWYAQEYNNSTIAWTGKNEHDQELPASTYFYVVIIPGGTYKGWVELIR
jgi:gliding motility-associated-like protein